MMKQQVTRDLYDYWDALRGTRLAPDRDDVEPGAIRACLANIVLLASEPAFAHQVRLAGTAICTMFGRELKGCSFATLWDDDSRSQLLRIISSIAADTVGAVVSVTGRNGEDETLELEMIVLPLLDKSGVATRLLGAFAPVSLPYWIGVRPVETLSAGAFRFVGPAVEAVPVQRLVAGRNNPLIGRGFVFYPAGGTSLISRAADG